MPTSETVQLLTALVERGYSEQEVVDCLSPQLPPFDVRQRGSDSDFDLDDNYNLPPQVAVKAVELGFPIKQLDLALAEFNLYWQERAGRPDFPHSMFIQHIEYLLRAGEA